MSRARQIIDMLEDGEPIIEPTVEPVAQTDSEYKVSPAGDPQHTHEMHADSEGNGALGAASVGEQHVHNMTNWEVQPSGSYPHLHAIVKEEIISPVVRDTSLELTPQMVSVMDQSPIAKALDALGLGEADKELDDEVADTKQKVKVVIPKTDPHVRRVFDQSGKYMGSFNTKDKKDQTKYKTMFKGGK